MALDALSMYFRKKFGLIKNNESINSGIKVWMPVFINDVNENTRLLLMEARRLESAAEKIKERRRRREEKEKESTGGFTSSTRRYYTAFLEYFE